MNEYIVHIDTYVRVTASNPKLALKEVFDMLNGQREYLISTDNPAFIEFVTNAVVTGIEQL